MQCPTCKVEIKQPGAIQCPECNAFLTELPEQEKTDDHASGLTETPDVFDSLLEEITEDVERILTSDEQDSGKTESETENDAKPVAADPEELIKLADEIETEIDEFDKHIQATGDIESGDHANGLTETPDVFDSLLEEITTDVGRILTSDEQDSGKTESETENDAKPVAADPEELIELADEIETEIDEFDKHIQATGDIESGADAAETVETAIEVPDEVIELTDPVEPEDVIQEVTEKELDIEIETIAESEEEMQEVEAIEPDPELELSVEPVSEVYGEDEIIIEQPEDDVEPAAVQKILFPEDDEDIEIIYEEDFEPTKAPEMEVEEEAIIEAPKKPMRSSKVIPALVGAAVLIVAVALGGRVFLQKQLKPTPSQTKPPKIVAATKNATPKQTIKKEVKKVAAEEKRLTVQKTHIEKKGNEQPKLDTRKETAVEREALAATEESKPLSIEGAKETVGQQALQTESQKDEKQKTDSEKAAPLVVAQKKLSPPEDEKETATTTIAATPPASGDTSPTDVAKITPFYTIQVGYYKNKDIADAELAGLKPKVYLAYIISKKNKRGFIRYRLRIGKYRTKEEAKKAAESYFDQEQTSYIIIRSEVEISP